MSELAFPLQWPQGWPRTHSFERLHGQFKGTLDQVRCELLAEIDLLVLGSRSRTHTIGDYVVISTNKPLRKDGFPRADSSEPNDPGVAVYFTRKEQPACFACDKYDRVWKNLRAIQKTIEALRGIDRWGSSQLLDRAFTGFAALPERTWPSCWDVLGLTPDATEEQILAAYRSKAKAAHPDNGGTTDLFNALAGAKDIALATRRSRS